MLQLRISKHLTICTFTYSQQGTRNLWLGHIWLFVETDEIYTIKSTRLKYGPFSVTQDSEKLFSGNWIILPTRILTQLSFMLPLELVFLKKSMTCYLVLYNTVYSQAFHCGVTEQHGDLSIYLKAFCASLPVAKEA